MKRTVALYASYRPCIRLSAGWSDLPDAEKSIFQAGSNAFIVTLHGKAVSERT